MKTYSAKKSDITRSWYLIDAEGKTLGRLAVRVAHLLRGKHKPIYTPNVDTGDYVIVVNAARVRLTGKKFKDKKYYSYSGYIGGLKEVSYENLVAEKPTQAIREAVKGMLPKNHLGRAMLKKLKVYADSKHPHNHHKPKVLEL